VARATTVRFSDEVFARLDQASARTGMPVNSIVVAACLEWMQRHLNAGAAPESEPAPPVQMFRPRWSTLRRAVQLAGSASTSRGYPFEAFSSGAQRMLTAAQSEAKSAGLSYIGTEHLLLAAFRDGTSDSARILGGLGISEQSVRSMLDKMLKANKARRSGAMVPTSRVKKVIELAFNLCGSMGAHRVTTGHILAALAREGDGIAARVLGELGLKPNAIESALAGVTEPER
jgi:ClpA/ClpB-like protein